MLKPGGTLLYATCSILKNENEVQIAQFLQNHSEAIEEKIILDCKTIIYRQPLSMGYLIPRLVIIS
jgi:16S rRNA (cytosine967-C5)-methyltransferase